MRGFIHLSDEALIKAYKDAVSLGLNDDFILLLKLELERRNLVLHKVED